MDFTIKKYKQLLMKLIEQGYSFQTFAQFLKKPLSRTIILRHDVDLLPENSLRFASIQKELGIKGTYYFRAVPQSWDVRIIVQIANMGHEIGYHYENLTTCNGNLNLSIQDFEKNLIKLRSLVPVKTICMHGSPMSKYDSKDLWKEFDYRDFDLIGEPYFDIDFNKVFYLTDTGRRWNGNGVSVRDKVDTIYSMRYRWTDEIILALDAGEFPRQVMFNFHPQRWHDNRIFWFRELVFQNFKNQIKSAFYLKNS